jgi:hypothetical protein
LYKLKKETEGKKKWQIKSPKKFQI